MYYYKAVNKFYTKYGKTITEILSYDIYEDKIICQRVVKELPNNVRRVSKGVVKEHFIRLAEKRNYLASLRLRTQQLKETLEQELKKLKQPIHIFNKRESRELYIFADAFIIDKFLRL